MFLADI